VSAIWDQVRKRTFPPVFKLNVKMIISPRQARGKRRESTQKTDRRDQSPNENHLYVFGARDDYEGKQPVGTAAQCVASAH
jgi:hypothetical protein